VPESDRRIELKPVCELLGVLLAVWLGLLGISALPRQVQPFGHQLVRSDLASWWDSPAIRAEPPQDPAARGVAARILSAAGSEQGTQQAKDESPQRILMIGDSMLDGLLPRLADYAVENGHSVNAVIWYGSRTIDWSRGTRLSDALRDYRPTYVMVVVGSSELTTRDIEKRAPAVQQILKLIGERKLVWIGPPNWRTDTGIGALLERELGPKRYFRSLDLTFERKRDKIHPTLGASRIWMDAVAGWIVTQSAAPIRLAPPQKSGAARPNARVFAPPAP
jgi:hypothetical protein